MNRQDAKDAKEIESPEKVVIGGSIGLNCMSRLEPSLRKGTPFRTASRHWSPISPICPISPISPICPICPISPIEILTQSPRQTGSAPWPSTHPHNQVENASAPPTPLREHLRFRVR